MDDSMLELGENLDIAIIGLASRFPGANTIAEFWDNLCHGVESITHFSDEDLLMRGVPADTIHDPAFVKSAPILHDVDKFDARFFGYSPKEAELMDPQQRLFLECAWEALEDAGHNPERFDGLIGVFAGTSLSTYLLFNVMMSPHVSDAKDSFQVMIGNDKDFLSTRLAYHFNLRGPSMTIQTGCSTSLVAVHVACQSLLSYQCDMVLAGGVSVNVPQRTGYFYQEGGITSADGHCRSFDAKAQGTLFGSGVGVVVLKRLSDAVAAGDHIYAVIKGSAVNNDGAHKIGYTAPGMDGQTEVIIRAQAIAGITADTVGYVEAHGTGTILGDPMEVGALTKAFQAQTNARQFCALGSVKTNIGHLDAAAGIAGLIKSALIVHYGLIPPSLHFEQPNPAIDFENSPFFVNTTLRRWQQGSSPRRAGVSSFGIGGTNAHVILEEALKVPVSSMSRPTQLLCLSTKSAEALDIATRRMADYLRQHDNLVLADVCYTSIAGRKSFEYRRCVVVDSVTDAVTKLDTVDHNHVFTQYQDQIARPIAFMFPGGGAQYVHMGRDLYEAEAVYREHFDHCSALLKPLLGYDLREMLFSHDTVAIERVMKQPSVALPALFTVEYSLSRLWMSWNILPAALIGHSAGEYVAACLAGVFSLSDALLLIVTRGRLFEDLPPGMMLSVMASEQELQELLPHDLSIAAVNAPQQCVVSGPALSIEQFAGILTTRDTEYRRLHIRVAAHSEMITSILGAFETVVRKLHLHQPTLPLISGMTGTWMTAAEAMDPTYWIDHLRRTVRFGDGLQMLMQGTGHVLLEVGPGQTLSTLARAQNALYQGVVSSMRHPLDKHSDTTLLWQAVGKLWLAGVELDAAHLFCDQYRHRVSLPTYPFERQRFWVDPLEMSSQSCAEAVACGKKSDVGDWFYLSNWQRTALPYSTKTQSRLWLVFADPLGLGRLVGARLVDQEQDVVYVEAGTTFARRSRDCYSIRPDQQDDYISLITALRQENRNPQAVIHFWLVESGREDNDDMMMDRGFFSLVFLTQALGDGDQQGIDVWVVSTESQDVSGLEPIQPVKAMALAPCKVAPQEMSYLRFCSIDIILPDNMSGRAAVTAQVVAECLGGVQEPTIAYRGTNRLVQRFQSIRLEQTPENSRCLRQQGVYLLLGGLGVVGFTLAEYLASAVQARLVLVGRSEIPARDDWSAWIASHDLSDPVTKKIHQIRRLEEYGAEVLYIQADIVSEAGIGKVISHAMREYGALHGVVHAAGVAGISAIGFISEITKERCVEHFHAKILGLRVLGKVLDSTDIDWCILISSNASILGGLGLTMYTAANLFMDAYAASYRNGSRWVSTNWDGWPSLARDQSSAKYQTSIDQYAMLTGESAGAFQRVVDSGLAPQVIVSTGDLGMRVAQWVLRQQEEVLPNAPPIALHDRPALVTAYVPPTDHVQNVIIAVWQELLGVSPIGIHDNFFDLGGNSLVGLKVISRLKTELGCDIPVVRLFESPTVSDFAQRLQQEPDASTAGDESVSRGALRREMRVQRQRGASRSKA